MPTVTASLFGQRPGGPRLIVDSGKVKSVGRWPAGTERSRALLLPGLRRRWEHQGINRHCQSVKNCLARNKKRQIVNLLISGKARAGMPNGTPGRRAHIDQALRTYPEPASRFPSSGGTGSSQRELRANRSAVEKDLASCTRPGRLCLLSAARHGVACAAHVRRHHG